MITAHERKILKTVAYKITMRQNTDADLTDDAAQKHWFNKFSINYKLLCQANSISHEDIIAHAKCLEQTADTFLCEYCNRQLPSGMESRKNPGRCLGCK